MKQFSCPEWKYETAVKANLERHINGIHKKT